MNRQVGIRATVSALAAIALMAIGYLFYPASLLTHAVFYAVTELLANVLSPGQVLFWIPTLVNFLVLAAVIYALLALRAKSQHAPGVGRP